MFSALLILLSTQVVSKEENHIFDAKPSHQVHFITNHDNEASQKNLSFWQQLLSIIKPNQHPMEIRRVERIGSIYDSPSDNDGD